MKNSEIIVRLDLGVVLDETRMSAEEVMDVVRCMDLNDMEVYPLAHVLRDIDTDRVVLFQDMQTGVNVLERYEG
jgi:hypothetical protein